TSSAGRSPNRVRSTNWARTRVSFMSACRTRAALFQIALPRTPVVSLPSARGTGDALRVGVGHVRVHHYDAASVPGALERERQDRINVRSLPVRAAPGLHDHSPGDQVEKLPADVRPHRHASADTRHDRGLAPATARGFVLTWIQIQAIESLRWHRERHL